MVRGIIVTNVTTFVSDGKSQVHAIDRYLGDREVDLEDNAA